MLEFAPESESLMTYEEALLYCQFCNHNGHMDWKMPTAIEYFSTPIEAGWFLTANEIPAMMDINIRMVTPVRDV
jgi:hypothetical protein